MLQCGPSVRAEEEIYHALMNLAPASAEVPFLFDLLLNLDRVFGTSPECKDCLAVMTMDFTELTGVTIPQETDNATALAMICEEIVLAIQQREAHRRQP